MACELGGYWLCYYWCIVFVHSHCPVALHLFGYYIEWPFTLLRPVHNIRLNERCDRKCIQNDLDACHNVCVHWLRNYFYSSVRDTRPNHFVCTSGRNTTQANYAMLAQAYIVNWPLVVIKWMSTVCSSFACTCILSSRLLFQTSHNDWVLLSAKLLHSQIVCGKVQVHCTSTMVLTIMFGDTILTRTLQSIW